MPDPKEREDATRRYFDTLAPEQHKIIYAQFFHTYLTSLEDGNPRQVEEGRKLMIRLIGFGKISEADRQAIEAKTCRLRAEAKHLVSEAEKACWEQHGTLH